MRPPAGRSRQAWRGGGRAGPAAAARARSASRRETGPGRARAWRGAARAGPHRRAVRRRLRGSGRARGAGRC